MLIRPTLFNTSNADRLENTQKTRESKDQHGNLNLLQIPTESLTHITSFLDPPTLLILAAVCTSLHEHVQLDATWRKAFFCQLLGIPPESNLSKVNTLLLRRTEDTWKNEFIARYKLKT